MVNQPKVKNQKPYEIGECRQTWCQPADTVGPNQFDHQFLTVESVDSGAGKFLVLKTERWAMDPEEVQNFCRQLQAFARQFCRDVTPSAFPASPPEPDPDEASG